MIQPKVNTEKMYQQSQTRGPRERGAGLLEYAILIALISVIAIGGIRILGVGVSDKFLEAALASGPETAIGCGGIGCN
jgi:Flp pilus assembly pilin Flp